jgi:hypothetical protein
LSLIPDVEDCRTRASRPPQTHCRYKAVDGPSSRYAAQSILSHPISSGYEPGRSLRYELRSPLIFERHLPDPASPRNWTSSPRAPDSSILRLDTTSSHRQRKSDMHTVPTAYSPLFYDYPEQLRGGTWNVHGMKSGMVMQLWSSDNNAPCCAINTFLIRSVATADDKNRPYGPNLCEEYTARLGDFTTLPLKRRVKRTHLKISKDLQEN